MKRCLPSEKSNIHGDFQHLFKDNLILLTDTPILALHSTTQSKPLCASFLTGLTLGKYTCNNVEFWRCKSMNALTITYAIFCTYTQSSYSRHVNNSLRKILKSYPLKSGGFGFWLVKSSFIMKFFITNFF